MATPFDLIDALNRLGNGGKTGKPVNSVGRQHHESTLIERRIDTLPVLAGHFLKRKNRSHEVKSGLMATRKTLKFRCPFCLIPFSIGDLKERTRPRAELCYCLR